MAEHSRLLHKIASLSRWWLAALAAELLVHCWATARANGGKASGREEHCLPCCPVAFQNSNLALPASSLCRSTDDVTVLVLKLK